jgi:hypothetical protein
MSSAGNFCCFSFREKLSQIEILTLRKTDLEHILESKFFVEKRQKTEKIYLTEEKFWKHAKMMGNIKIIYIFVKVFNSFPPNLLPFSATLIFYSSTFP